MKEIEMKRIKAKNNLGDYDFTFTLYKNNKLWVQYTYNYFDTSDYGFIDLSNISAKKVTSYSDYAAQKTMYALKNAGISTQKLKKIANTLCSIV